MALPRNGYNTPGMNTYATPQGTVASGLGDAGPGSDALIDRYRRQQTMNSMTPSQRAYVQRFGGQPAAPESPAVSAPPPMSTSTLREQERMYVPRNQSDGSIGQSRFIEGVPTQYGSNVIKDPRTGRLALFGGQAGELVGQNPSLINEVRAGAGRNETARIKAQLASGTGGYAAAKRYATKQREIMARRAALQSGRPLQERFGGAGTRGESPGTSGPSAAPQQAAQQAAPGNRIVPDYQPRDPYGQPIDPFGANGMTRTDPLTGAIIPQTPPNVRPSPTGNGLFETLQRQLTPPPWAMNAGGAIGDWWHGNRRR